MVYKTLSGVLTTHLLCLLGSLDLKHTQSPKGVGKVCTVLRPHSTL